MKQATISHHKKNKGGIEMGLQLDGVVTSAVGLGSFEHPTVKPAYPDLTGKMEMNVPAAESALDNAAYQLFGKSWKWALAAIWEFECQFESAPEHERKRMMMNFVAGGMAKSVSNMMV